MTFQEARDKLDLVSGGRYRALYYELVEHEDGSFAQICRLYIDPGTTHDQAPTWEDAFRYLERAMGHGKSTVPDGMPE